MVFPEPVGLFEGDQFLQGLKGPQDGNPLTSERFFCAARPDDDGPAGRCKVRV